MGAVVSRGSLEIGAVNELDMVKQHLRITHNAEDVLITMMITSAKESADEYLNNPFVDSLGVDKPIPSAIKTWLLERIGRMYEKRIEGISSISTGGLSGSVTWTESDYSSIEQFRLNPGL
jgi:uncharacterized phage protein (predicted DNA packaging)